ncbi:alpha-galactosidase [Sphingomonas sp. ID1715]|uniref:glycoside hydrolase family 36 protein n=1 Tax=Sphingomonas sp. ID1715 TaxID=1656898 RepID=UPI001487ABDD|nr:glycoside hydrolase family 36 protein [Sphingomonas sp. ID1715]NNM76482.1 alpha-galactosidase [Sphingomonas sp. ID1715]
MRFDGQAFEGLGIRLGGIVPLLDGEPAQAQFAFGIERDGERLRLLVKVSDLDPTREIDSIGIRFEHIAGMSRYLRHGYQSWDGSFFADAGTLAGDGPPLKAPTLGYAATALLPSSGDGAVVLGFTRHDRFQSRFRFGGTAEAPTVSVETLWDRVPHDGSVAMEPLILFDGPNVEEALRDWARIVAAESPLPPRVPDRRVTGWCSWYNLYAAITEENLLEHLAAARAFRDDYRVPLDIFQIDDGFTPEMGDWLEVKPQFPRGMKPLLDDVRAAGFTPGLWIAPFMVGNRSRLYREHPDWVVADRRTGGPLAQMTFYGEFRWHKRSEEYYILDVTHPDAEAYIRQVFRTWAGDWGAGYFKTDFMLFGSEHGPDRAVWHQQGFSRIAVWRKMAALIREEIGDALWLGCGCPLWASVGLVDAVRIGRDVGVTWTGEYSAESLLRDQVSRNHGAGILWQADPDCVLLRDRFHELSDDQVTLLARFAAYSGGVLMTSDKLDELSPERAALFAELLRQPIAGCDFPQLGHSAPLLEQRVRVEDEADFIHRLNLTAEPVAGLLPFSSRIE